MSFCKKNNKLERIFNVFPSFVNGGCEENKLLFKVSKF
jgi:hypothetical protein